MNVSVLVERLDGNGYRATALMPAPLVAEARTRDEALERVRALIAERLKHVELVDVEVPPPPRPNPWLAIAGTWRDHPDLEEVMENIAEYRREVDADPNRP